MKAFRVALATAIVVLGSMRRATGSPVAPAILHGSFNASAGIVLLLCGGSRVLAPPLGLLGAAAWLPAGAVAWWFRTRLRLRTLDARGSSMTS
jgi:hypothetical protein